MLRVITATFFALAMSMLFVCELTASPAATQNWVRDYVATNYAGGVSKEWVQGYVATNTASATVVSNVSTYVSASLARATSTACQILMDGGSNSVDRAVQQMNMDASVIVDYIFENTMGY